MIAYAFHSVPGFSKFGSYVGNASTDGPFVFCGFRPAYILYKKSSAAGTPWIVMDSVRNTYNPLGLYVLPDVTDAEATADVFDFTANGFKLRSSHTYNNESGATYIFMAFAESPFGGSGVAQARAR
jgi:hypothetical protein